MDHTEQKRERNHQFFKVHRKQLMDSLQIGCGHLPNWDQIRSRVLKIMGRDGLESLFLDSQLHMNKMENTDFYEVTRD